MKWTEEDPRRPQRDDDSDALEPLQIDGEGLFIPCEECGELGHLAHDCPLLQLRAVEFVYARAAAEQRFKARLLWISIVILVPVGAFLGFLWLYRAE